jgi:hypothetical protein
MDAWSQVQGGVGESIFGAMRSGCLALCPKGCTGFGGPGRLATRAIFAPLTDSGWVRAGRLRHLRTHSALADGASPAPNRVISTGLKFVGLAPTGRSEQAVARGQPGLNHMQSGCIGRQLVGQKRTLARFGRPTDVKIRGWYLQAQWHAPGRMVRLT